MHIVLVEPEIPQNTGNIARTCALTRSKLHLIQPLGFSLEDRYLKRAGLDYWHLVDLKVWDDFYQFRASMKGGNIFLATTKADRCYHQVNYRSNDAIVFGCETKGLPVSILEAFSDSLIRIPMLNIGRSLNLGNSAAIILYEALRQLDYNGLK